MNIVIAGIKRSGSTAQYNMVRLVLEQAGIEYNSIGHDGKLKSGNNLVKRHPYLHRLYEQADYIFTTDRGDKDILKSLNRIWGSGNPERLNLMRYHLNKWKRNSIHMEYEEITGNPLKCIETIARTLNIKVDCQAVLKDFMSIKPPNEGQDPVTLLFKDHVSNS